MWVWIPLMPLKLWILRLLRARGSLTFRQTMECRFTLKLVIDMIITYSQMHCKVLTTELSPLGRLAKWLSVGLRIKWLWVRIPLLSLKLQIWRLLRARSSFTSFKAFLKSKKKSGTSLPASFSAWILKKNILLVIFYYLTKFHCLVAFTTWGIGQYVYCNYLLTFLWRLKFWK